MAFFNIAITNSVWHTKEGSVGGRILRNGIAINGRVIVIVYSIAIDRVGFGGE